MSCIDYEPGGRTEKYLILVQNIVDDHLFTVITQITLCRSRVSAQDGPQLRCQVLMEKIGKRAAQTGKLYTLTEERTMPLTETPPALPSHDQVHDSMVESAFRRPGSGNTYSAREAQHKRNCRRQFDHRNNSRTSSLQKTLQARVCKRFGYCVPA